MTVTHVNSQIGAPNQGSSPALSATSVVTKPTGLAVGDVMVNVVMTNAGGTITAPAGQGWTRLVTKDATTTGPFRVEIWWVIATSTHTAASNFTWTTVDALGPTWAATSAYRGVDQNSPINTSNFNIGGASSTQVGPSITTTYKSMILYVRAVRRASTTAQSFSGSQTEQWDGSNHGSTIGYSGQLQDSNGEIAAGSIAGTSTTFSTTCTDTLSFTVALRSADVSAAPAQGVATAAAYNPTIAVGQSVTAGKASVTAAAKTPSALTGQLAFPGLATATTATPDVGRRAYAGVAAASATGSPAMLFYGTPSFRLKQVPAENRTLAVGTNREAAG